MGENNVPHLGQYRLDNKIGEGGMGVVYQATDEKLHREVAVKVLHPHLLQNDNLKERFRREARMHAKLMHPNVVTLLSIFEDNEHMALVMEMVHGKNLKEYLRAHPSLSLIDLVKICDSILAGLEAAHHLGMVHRDLKPANVLLSTDGAIKLMDFGLAKPKKGDDDLTQSGATVGSFRYMAPEQILNQPVDARTDLYAFGILLYQAVTGKLPFDATASGGGEFEIMEKQVREDPVAPHELVPSMPLALSDLILRLLAKSPADRPMDCKEVRDDLHALLKQEPEASRRPAVRMPVRSASEDSNTEIAKGLLRALGQGMVGRLQKLTNSVKPGVSSVKKSVEQGVQKTAASLPIAKQWQAPLTWGVLLLFVVGVGWLLISVLDLAERPSAQQPVESELAKVEETKKGEAKQPTAETGAEADAVKPEEKQPAAKTEKSKVVEKKLEPVAKPRPKPKPKRKVVRGGTPVTNFVSHKIKRSDFSSVNPKSHEFRGATRLWFESLKDYKWKDRFRSYKKGWIRLYLDKPQNLSRIYIKRASVGRLDFKGGEVSLEVQNSRGKWTEVFIRKDDDIDIPVNITRPKKALDDVNGVRLRFKTPEPIEIGPIDLIR